MRQLSSIALFVAGCALLFVLCGCGSGGSERGVGGGQAVFSFELRPGEGVAGLVSPRGQTTPVDGVSLKSADPMPGVPQTGVFQDGDRVLGFVSVVNDDPARSIVDVSVSVTTPPTGWTSNDAVWNYGAVDVGPATESAPIRWVFVWTGGGAPQAATFEVTVNWSAGPVPPLGSDFNLPIVLTATGATGETIEAGTDPLSVDRDDANDQPAPIPSPGTWVRGFFPHPEWQFFGGIVVDFVKDIRATLRTGGQTKTWDFVVECNAASPAVTMTWDTGVLPAGLSAQMIDVDGMSGAPMAIITSPFASTPNRSQLVRFQLVVSAT